MCTGTPRCGLAVGMLPSSLPVLDLPEFLITLSSFRSLLRRECPGGLWGPVQATQKHNTVKARPGLAELTAVGFCISARLHLGEDLLAGQDGDASRVCRHTHVCGRSMTAGGAHSHICGALWQTVVDRRNAVTQAWPAAESPPPAKHLSQRPRATGLSMGVLVQARAALSPHFVSWDVWPSWTPCLCVP